MGKMGQDKFLGADPGYSRLQNYPLCLYASVPPQLKGCRCCSPSYCPFASSSATQRGSMYRNPQSQVHALPIEPPVSLRCDTEQWCVPSEEKSLGRGPLVLYVGLGARGIEGGRAQTPWQPSFPACKPVLAPASCAPLVSHHREAA